MLFRSDSLIVFVFFAVGVALGYADAVPKILGVEFARTATEGLGFPPYQTYVIGWVLLACVIAWVIPRTAVLGAVGLTAYLGGAVTIDGEGLNASNVERFDIITRSAKINAQINARELNVIAGRNDVDAQSLKTTPRADDGSAKPELAIDSSALGGMYAGAIKLVGTEAGVGVKLDGTLAASGGDIQLDATGQTGLETDFIG